MVVAVEYISKEESADAETAKHGVTGILAVQGAFAEHAAMLDKLGAQWKLLRAAEDFDDSIDRVILPGGESTTQGKLLRSTGLFEPIAAHIAAGKPVFGTCAGMILLAKRLENDDNVYFGALDATVRRNAYGRQLGSFVSTADFGDIKDFPLVFIRGPFVSDVGADATIETEVDGRVVGLRQGNILATAFHPELTDDTRIHELFLSLYAPASGSGCLSTGNGSETSGLVMHGMSVTAGSRAVREGDWGGRGLSGYHPQLGVSIFGRDSRSPRPFVS